MSTKKKTRIARSTGATRSSVTAKPRAERLARRRAVAREEIVVAATQTLLRTGVNGFTFDAVARDLSITKMGLYYHFPAKDDLVRAICLAEWTTIAQRINEATSRCATASDALEALIRTYVARYLDRLALFTLITQEVTLSPLAQRTTQQDLKSFRPLNDLLYGPTEALLQAETGLVKGRVGYHPRRLAFVAHTAAMGLLAMKSMVESVNDPLMHSDRDLLDELCQVFRAAVR
jgi:AcrR family transcriptional regulator